MRDVLVAWWNLENLFDHETAVRDPELASAVRSDVRGWTPELRDRKLDQLASIVTMMFEGAGPDLIGVCEVENEDVLSRLKDRLTVPRRHYEVLHHSSPDARGIDVSFILDENVLAASNPRHQVVVKRTATRDIFWATMTMNATGAQFVAIANHWPARSAGQYKSEPYRMLTGETVSYVLSRLLDPDDGDPNRPVLLMGDFNDQPFNRSMREYLLGTHDPKRVTGSPLPRLLNLMWPLMAENQPGTYRYDADWNMLDQFLVNKPFLRADSPVQVLRDSVAIFRPDRMQGRAGASKAFGRPSRPGGFDPDGYSDHYPITVVLRAT